MSTRASFVYTENAHIYEELLNDWIYIELSMKGANDYQVCMTIPIMPAHEFYKQIREKYAKEANYWQQRYDDAMAVNQQLVAKLEDK